MNNNKKFNYGYIIVASLFLQIFVAGSVFSTCGLFVLPISTSLGVSQGTYMIYQTIQYTVNSLFCILTPFIAKRIPFRHLNKIGILLIVAGMVVMANAKGIAWVYAAGAIWGIGMTFSVVLTSGLTLPKWFPANLATMLAIPATGLSCSGVVMSPIYSALLNRPSMLGMETWRGVYILMAIIVGVICMLNACFIQKEAPASIVEAHAAAMAKAGPSAVVEKTGIEKSRALKSKAFLFVFIMGASWNIAAPVQVYMASFAALSEAGAVAKFDLVGIMSSILMIGGMVGNWFYGLSNRRWGGVGGATVAGIFGPVACIILMLFSHSPALMLIGAFLFGVYYTIHDVQLPVMVNEAFGQKAYDEIYPTLAGCLYWICAITTPIWGFIYDATGSYNGVFAIGAVMCLITGISGILCIKTSKVLWKK